ncbi:sugar phosphate isomerase/epimerase family protein [Jeotgalibacillus soli]|uniref:Xylose isomerase-like TIM barrel domain-containing protein n=1 Tax=Jeotgalibacillus soli TaxID=889306 RepID=A0A0C2RGX9_9BACL|nr:sugar phosphate isomerase/epimerase family protein [Jeotgalibacillus soli]KIL49425.1 hypothetical protein KP78_08930 [Jeotgalibacillus soli]
MFQYSATQWIFGNEELEDSLKRLKKFGYDGVELAGEPYTINIQETKELLEKYDMVCTSICGIFKPERDLSSDDDSTRKNAVQYVKDCIDMAVELGAPTLIVVPTFVEKVSPGTNEKDEWNNAVESIKEAGLYAVEKGINLAIEALNRYETYLVSNLDLAVKLADEINISSVNIMADLFHMSIEERNMVGSLKKISKYLVHVHIADNTREAAGLGQIDFAPVMAYLKELNYKGSITMEFLPPISNPYLVSNYEGESTVYDDFTKQSIDHIKEIVETL